MRLILTILTNNLIFLNYLKMFEILSKKIRLHVFTLFIIVKNLMSQIYIVTNLYFSKIV